MDFLTTEYLLNREVEQVLGCLTDANRLVLQVCLHTGLRVGDVLALRTEQLKPRFWVTEAKTGKRRMVGLPEPLLAAIREQAGEVWAFPGRSGDQPRTRQAVWKDLKRAAQAYRLPQNVAPHSFRKIFAVDLLEKYGDIERVQRALNHSSPSVTLIYAMADKRLQAGALREAVALIMRANNVNFLLTFRAAGGMVEKTSREGGVPAIRQNRYFGELDFENDIPEGDITFLN